MKSSTLIPPTAMAIALACSVLTSFAAPAAYPLVPAVESTPRGGLPNVTAKLKAGGEVKIGYLGGSITAAAGWRVKSLAWFQSQYPNAKVSEINAAIGGTGSDLGVFRVKQDIISQNPELLFIEFAVNDGGADPEKIHQGMEGIVRQTWKANPLTDICFVYTISDSFLKEMQGGNYPRAASAMEAVANHYSIPSVHFGVDVAKRVTDSTLIFKATKEEAKATQTMVFSNDGVHPLVETGHELYTQTLARTLPGIFAVGETGPHAVGAPLRADNWENAKIVPITQSMLKGNWTLLDPTQPGHAKWYASRLPALWKATEPGASLEFVLNGSFAQVYDIVGPDCGGLDVVVDGKPAVKLPRFDRYSSSHRLSKGNLFGGETGRNTIKVTLSAEPLDKLSILAADHVEKYKANLDAYKPHVWCLGSLLIIGEVE